MIWLKNMLDFNEYSKIIKECKALSNRKNAIYGVNNLKLFNGLSILVRINDKIARLNNLCHQTLEDWSKYTLRKVNMPWITQENIKKIAFFVHHFFLPESDQH